MYYNNNNKSTKRYTHTQKLERETRIRDTER